MKLISKVAKALLLAAFVVITSQSYGQCNFQAGDIAFVGYNSYDSNTGAAPNDKFSFILLRDLPANTNVYFTDFGWTSSNGFQSKTYSKSDGVLRWSHTALIPAGTQVVINCKYTPTASLGTIDLAGSTNTANTDASVTKEYISLGIQGDQLFAFTGSVAAPTLIAGITVNNAAWDAVLDPTKYTSSESVKPGALNTAQNTIVSNATSDAYNAVYNGPVYSNTATSILNAINTASNWIKDATAGAATGSFALPLSSIFTVAGPSIVSSPVDKLICPGQGTTFTATANNTCSYKWQVDKGDGNGFVYVSNGGVYSGATTNTLSISNVTGLHLYKYRMEAQGVTTPLAYSSAATLTVIQTPVVDQNPQNVLAAAGDNVTFSVAYSNNTAVTVQWQVSTNGGGSFTDIPSATGDNYSFTPTLAQDGYQYRAIVKNGCSLSATSTAATLTIKPQVTSIVRAGGAAQSTNASSVNYTVTFSKAVTGVDATDFALTTTGSIASLSIGSVSAVSGAVYTVAVNTGNGDGSVRLDFNNTTGVVPTAAATFTTGETYILDRTAPTGTIVINTGASATNNTNVTLALTTNDATVMSFSNDGTTWSSAEAYSASKIWTMTSAEGTKTVYVRLADALGNQAIFSDAIILDTTAPIVSGVANGYYNTDVTITFNEGTATLNGSAFIQGTTVTTNGSYVLAVTDAAGNVTIVSFVIDKTAPTISIGNPSVATTKSGPVTFTITYADANFAQSTLAAANVTINSTGTASAASKVVSGAGTTRTVTLSSITGDGTLGISIAANTAADLAGNTAATAGPSVTFIVDNTAPTSTFTSTPLLLTNNSGATFVFSNNESGSTFEGSLDGTSFTSVTSPKAFTALADGSHTFKVRSIDAMGNIEATPASYTWTVDTAPPTVSIVSGPAAVSLSTSATFIFAASEVGVTYEAKLDANTFATVTNPVTYSSLADGAHSLQVRAVDGAGNTGSIQTYNWTIDTTPPAVLSITRNTPSSAITNSTSLVYKVNFSEPVTGIDFSDFSITTTGTAAALMNGVSASSGTSITVSLNTVSGNGTVQIALKNSGTGIIDAAGNAIAGFSSGEIYTIDHINPSVVLTTTAANPTNGNFTVTATFSEDITGFSTGDLIVSNATVTNFLVVDGKTYTFDVSPTSSGTVSITVAGASVVDLAGNLNTPGIFSIVYDSTRPTVTLSSAAPVNINSAITFQINFSEVVNGFTENDITVNNGTISNLQTTDNKTYTATLTPSSEGFVTVSIAAGVAQDAAGNTNTATTSSLDRVYDTGKPTVVLSTTAPSLTNQVITVTATFNEAVTGLTASDFSLTNASVTSLSTTNGSTYTLVISPNADGAVSVELPADIAFDAALNTNYASNKLTVTYDGSAPVVTSVNSPLANRYGPGNTLNFTVNYNENVIVTGSPILQIVIGSTTVNATYQGGSGTNSLLFNYTVQSGQMDNDGIVISALAFNGGTIADGLGNANINPIVGNQVPISGVLVDGVAPVITANQVFSINENSALNSLTAAVAITDAGNMGVLQNATIVSLIDTDNDGVQAFRIDPLTGYLYVNDVDEFDYETNQQFVLTLTISDGINTSLAQSVTIKINDVNEAPTDLTLSGNTIAENSAIGTIIGTLSTTDADAGSTFTYSLVAGVGATDNASVVIVGNALKTSASFDFETKNSYSIRVKTTDNGGLTFEKVITISVTDINEAPTAIALSNNIIPENNAVGATVGTLVTTDVDAGSAFTYALVAGTGSTDNASFSIVGNELQAAASFDFETKNSYSIRVRTTDNGGLSYEQVLAVQVADVDEAPTDLALSTSSIVENNAVGATIGSLSSADPNPSATFTYSLVAGTGSTDNASFTIVGNELKAASSFDFETKNNYSVRIQTTNNKGLSFEKAIAISITDQPENPTALTLSNNSVNENSNAGSLVGTLAAADQDASSTFTYALVTGAGDNGNTQFTITGNELKTAANFDYESQNTYTIRVKVTDNTGLSLEKNFTVTINDVNESPTLDAIANVEVCASSDEETVVLTGLSAGPETNQTVLLTVAADNNIFKKLSVDNVANGKSLVHFQLKDGASGNANIIVTVKDNGGSTNGGTDTFNRSFNVTVNTLPELTISSSGPVKISKGDILELTANGLFNAFSWNNDAGIIGVADGKVLKVRPMQTTTYKVKGTTDKGCIVWAEITVEVIEDFKLDATNVITPNGDGHNDKWLVRNIESYPNNIVKIFDRAGRIIYTQKGYANEWDGTMNGQPLHEDTYYYIIDLGNGAKLYKGYITIVRD